MFILYCLFTYSLFSGKTTNSERNHTWANPRSTSCLHYQAWRKGGLYIWNMDSLLFWWDRYWQLFQRNLIHTYTFPINKITSWHVSSSKCYVQLLNKLSFMGHSSCAQSLYYTIFWTIWIQSINSYIISVRLILILSSLLHLHNLNRLFP